MTAVLPCPATAPATGSRSAAHDCTATALYVWGLSVGDWQVHALARPTDVVTQACGMQRTRCEQWESMACPVSVARRDEVCPRCMAGGLARLDVLPERPRPARCSECAQ